MFSHVAKDFLSGLAFFSPNSSDTKIAPEPAALRVEALAAQVFAFLDAHEIAGGDTAPQAKDQREPPLAA